MHLKYKQFALLSLFVSHSTAITGEVEINKPGLFILEDGKEAAVCTNETMHKESCDAESDADMSTNKEEVPKVTNESNNNEAKLKRKCADSYEACAEWASLGECDKNPEFMLQSCKKSCKSCMKEPSAQETSVERSSYENLCIDWSDKCSSWASAGECNENPDYMLYFCRYSCNACQECADEDNRCSVWAEAGECEGNPEYMQYYCKKSCGVCLEYTMGVEQIIGDDADGAIQGNIQASRDYFVNDVMIKPEFAKVRDLCKNRHENCAFWAAAGECETSAGFMQTNCALSCQTCHLLDINVRCPIDKDVQIDALRPGDLNKMFLKITNSSTESEFAKFEPVVHSRPLLDLDEDKPRDFQVGPWVVTFESFLTEEECDRLIEMGEKRGFERSKVDAKKRSDGFYDSDVTEDRTSKNTWCSDECYEDPVTQRITERIVNMTGIPEPNMEMFQMLKYEVGEYYLEHNDFNVYHSEGPRVLTFFIYLNDVEEGGGTSFPQLNNLTVKPRKGKALLWPSVVDSDPRVREDSTSHEALPVVKGTKYSANAWIHLHDFKAPHKLGCTG